MADMMSILSSHYTAAALNTGTKTPYKNVDAKSYEGTWQGTYANTKKFKVTVSDVSGFRAQVKYESEGSLKFQSVLIKDNSFRVGDSKFTLTGNNKATVKTAVTDPVTSQTSLVTGTAKRDV
ncbi:hypothetical protein HNR60_004307 [Rhodopseudomonas rhenobacensis]|uniref:Uncharacterized protein n=1 Tax=Rhodopseudomonas rhenobacensis TaxID=87461 RepID=A0A7W7Z7V5_9BRAD|nr:hypothetical protein [Rhodopseudomonas rhenobacensis]MBB5049529.1 hypothetical protein [Rhodopseudomonas rhenobacensis]